LFGGLWALRPACAANGNTLPCSPHPRVSFAYFDHAPSSQRPPFRSPVAPSASFTVPEVPKLADAGGMQPVLRDRSDSPTDLVLERQVQGLFPPPQGTCCWGGAQGDSSQRSSKSIRGSVSCSHILARDKDSGNRASLFARALCLGLADKTSASMMSRTWTMYSRLAAQHCARLILPETGCGFDMRVIAASHECDATRFTPHHLVPHPGRAL
jgi:hypothetical protein